MLKGFDPELNRFVAIKVLDPNLAHSAAGRRRFAREAKAAASVVHDHVVAIHAVDRVGELPYLVMAYVHGKSLQERLDRAGALDVIEIVRIGMQTAAGLAAAHAQGLVHRDIKPANILLENGVERVKITDFGLARAADDASISHSGIVAGTPQFMSPEQARGEAVDHRSDLFSLGSVLYMLCTGQATFRAAGSMATLLRVCEATPRPIRDLNPLIPEWLGAIIEHLHEKDPAQRYQSAAEVAALLERCLAHLQQPRRVPLPPIPRKPRPAARRRQRPLAAAMFATLAVLGIGIGFSEALGATRLLDAIATVLRIRTEHGTLVVESSDPSLKISVIGEEITITGADAPELHLKPGAYEVRAEKDGSIRQKELVSITRGEKRVVRIGFEPVATQAAAQGRARVPTPPLPVALDTGAPLGGGSFSLGKYRANESASAGPPDDVVVAPFGLVAPVEPVTNRFPPIPTRSYHYVASRDQPIQLSPQGDRLALGCRSDIALLDLRQSDEKPTYLKNQRGTVLALAFNTAGKALASATSDGIVRLWDLPTQKIIAEQVLDPADTVTLGNANGQMWVAAAQGNLIQIMDLATHQPIATLEGTGGSFTQMCFSPEGKLLVAAGRTQGDTVRITAWDIASRRQTAQLDRRTGPIDALMFSADGKTLVIHASPRAGDQLPSIAVFDAASFRILRMFVPAAVATATAVSGDSRFIAVGNANGFLRIQDLTSGLVVADYLKAHDGAIWRLAFSADGSTLVTAGKDQLLKVWSVAARATSVVEPYGQGVNADRGTPPANSPLELMPGLSSLQRLPLVGPLFTVAPSKGGIAVPKAVWHQTDAFVQFLTFSSDSRFLLVGTNQNVALVNLRALDQRPIALPAQGGVRRTALSANGAMLAVAMDDGVIKLWDTMVQKVLAQAHVEPSALVAFRSLNNGHFQFAAALGNNIKLWDLPAGRQLGLFPSSVTIKTATALCFSADGRYLLVAGTESARDGGCIITYDIATQEIVRRQFGSYGRITEIQASRDGTTLAVVAQQGSDKQQAIIHVLGGEPWQFSRPLRSFTSAPPASATAVSADNQLVATGAATGYLWLQDFASQRVLADYLKAHDGAILRIAFAPDRKLLATAGADGLVKLWNIPATPSSPVKPAGAAESRN